MGPWPTSFSRFLQRPCAGPLQQPRGQTSVLYSVPDAPDPARMAEARARSQAAVEAAEVRAGTRGSLGRRGAGRGVHAAFGWELCKAMGLWESQSCGTPGIETFRNGLLWVRLPTQVVQNT